VWTRQGPFVANRYGGTAFLQNKHLLGIMMFMEINDGTGFQNLCQHNDVFGPAILLIDLNDEFRDGTCTSRQRLSYWAA
jgi:hypothetical protein